MRRAAVAVVIVGALGLTWLLVRSGDEPRAPRGSAAARGTAAARGSAAVIDPARAPKMCPGAARPAAEEERAPDLAELRAAAREIADPDPAFVVDSELAAQAKANLECVRVARESGDHPERLDPRIEPPPFDRLAFKRDPQAYLDVVEPGRVWQAADESSGADPLRARGPTELTVARGDRVELAVAGTGSTPVTFTSLDGGALDNGLASITVRAKNTGVASVVLTATADMPPVVTVLAASPYSSGIVRFTVRIGAR